MSANFNDEDDETWLYGAAANEEVAKTNQNSDNINARKYGKQNVNHDNVKDHAKQQYERDAIESQENLVLGMSKSEIFDFGDTVKINNPNNNEDHNPDEINYDVDATFHEEITHEDTETTMLTTVSNNNSDFPIMTNSMINQEKNGDQEDTDEDEDEDDEDNMVNVVISDIVNKPYSTQLSSEAGGQFLNRQKGHQLTSLPSTAATQATGANTKIVSIKGVDLDAPGTINEQPTFEYDLAEVKDEDKPWRMPGADITDYFNYGFTEESWIQYCMKQKRLRAENSAFKNTNGVNVLVPIQPSGPGFPGNTNGFQQQGVYPSYQNRINPQFQPRFGQPPPTTNIPQGNFVPRKIGQVGGVDVLSTRPAESRPQTGMFPVDPTNSMPSADFSAPPPGWALGSGRPPPQLVQQQAATQSGMITRAQLPPPIRGSAPINMPPPQISATGPGMPMMQQQPNYQNPQFPQASPYGFQPLPSVPPPNMDNRPFNSLAPSIYNQPPPFVRASGPPLIPGDNRLTANLTTGPTWEKPTTVESQQQQQYFDGNHSPSRYRRSSRSSTPGISSPKRRHSKSPTHQSNEASKYSARDQENKSSTHVNKHRRDYSSKDHRRSPSSPSRRSYRHRDHERYDKRRSRDKSRDRSRSRDKSRDRSRDKSRERSRSRDDKYKRRRKSVDDEDYRSSSKSHKRSKKSSRKERDVDENKTVKSEPLIKTESTNEAVSVTAKSETNKQE